MYMYIMVGMVMYILKKTGDYIYLYYVYDDDVRMYTYFL